VIATAKASTAVIAYMNPDPGPLNASSK